MAGIVIVGAQWGDEGKGKIVDLLADNADLVIRFQGGNNAGHTIVRDGETGYLVPPRDPEALADRVAQLFRQPRVMGIFRRQAVRRANDLFTWARVTGAIANLYARLLERRPTPVVELNRAVAVAMAEGPQAGLAIVDGIKARGQLSEYYLLWATEADLLRRLERPKAAAEAYRKALELVSSEPERRFLERRLAEVSN